MRVRKREKEKTRVSSSSGRERSLSLSLFSFSFSLDSHQVDPGAEAVVDGDVDERHVACASGWFVVVGGGEFGGKKCEKVGGR